MRLPIGSPVTGNEKGDEIPQRNENKQIERRGREESGTAEFLVSNKLRENCEKEQFPIHIRKKTNTLEKGRESKWENCNRRTMYVTVLLRMFRAQSEYEKNCGRILGANVLTRCIQKLVGFSPWNRHTNKRGEDFGSDQ